MLLYAFSALVIKSVSKADNQMVEEVRRQLAEVEQNSSFEPEYAKYVEILTKAALVEMILPGTIVMLTQMIKGWLCGLKAVQGFFIGILIAESEWPAISSSNSRDAWDEAKKCVEKEQVVSKSDIAFKDIITTGVTGDTVGEKMKDTSGPSLNTLVKLSAIDSLIFGGLFTSDWAALLFK